MAVATMGGDSSSCSCSGTRAASEMVGVGREKVPVKVGMARLPVRLGSVVGSAVGRPVGTVMDGSCSPAAMKAPVGRGMLVRVRLESSDVGSTMGTAEHCCATRATSRKKRFAAMAGVDGEAKRKDWEVCFQRE